MGISYKRDRIMGVPLNYNLCKILIDKYNIKTFIETGTFEARTVRELCDQNMFENLITIEYSKYFYETCINKYKEKYPKITWLNGKSTDFLPDIIKKLDNNRAIFWLDAHDGIDSELHFMDHPILEELNIVANAPVQHIILLDDANGFESLSGYPNKNHYPSLDRVIPAIIKKYDYTIAIIYDCIVCLPREDESLFINPEVTKWMNFLKNDDFEKYCEPYNI